MFQPDRPADQIDAYLITATLTGDHSEQMQAVCMMGIYCQNLPIDPLGLGQAPGLMVPKRIPQHDLNDPRRSLPRSPILFLCERMSMAIHGLRVSISRGRKSSLALSGADIPLKRTCVNGLRHADHQPHGFGTVFQSDKATRKCRRV